MLLNGLSSNHNQFAEFSLVTWSINEQSSHVLKTINHVPLTHPMGEYSSWIKSYLKVLFVSFQFLYLFIIKHQLFIFIIERARRMIVRRVGISNVCWLKRRLSVWCLLISIIDDHIHSKIAINWWFIRFLFHEIFQKNVEKLDRF
jgi:hypothetical protein